MESKQCDSPSYLSSWLATANDGLTLPSCITSKIKIQHYHSYSSHHEQRLLPQLRCILSHYVAEHSAKAEEKHEQRYGLKCEQRNDEDDSDNDICHFLSKPAHPTPNAAIDSPALPQSDTQSTELIKISNTVVASLPA
jgi:hypothetical protein